MQIFLCNARACLKNIRVGRGGLFLRKNPELIQLHPKIAPAALYLSYRMPSWKRLGAQLN